MAMRHAVTYAIVGAGLAGCTCGYLLQQAHQNVIVLEKAEVAKKDKLCAGLITPRAMRLLEQIYGSGHSALYRSAFDHMRVSVDAHDIELDGISMKSVQRAELDRFALDAYLATGGKLVDSLSIRDIDARNGVITGFRSREAFSCSYDVLIAADGALSPTRRLQTGVSQDCVLMLETSVEHTGLPLIISYDSSYYGYSWYAPVGQSAKLGCACYAGGEHLKEQLARFAACLDIEPRRVRGAYVPTGRDVLLKSEHCHYIGDAAGLVCPISGEGIYFALYSAQQLSRALLNSASYPALMQSTADEIARQYHARPAFFSKRLIDVGLAAARLMPDGERRALRYVLRRYAGYEC